MSDNLKEELLLKSDQLKKSDTRPLFICIDKVSSHQNVFTNINNCLHTNQVNIKSDNELNSNSSLSKSEGQINDNLEQIPKKINEADTNYNDFNNNISILTNLNDQKHQMSFLFTNQKAGMEGLDRDQINKIIYECTKNSTITKKKQEEYDIALKVVEDWKIKLQSLHKNSLIYEQNRKLAEVKMREIQKTRDLSKIWMHIDMDMFYAAVEIRDDPSIKDIPIAVGSESMICTSNYIARKFGVRSAMPGFIGKRLCPNLKFIPTNFEKYKTESEKIMNILREYDKDLDVRGLDEAFLDLTPYCHENYITTHGELESVIMEIKFKIFDQTKLTCSIGVSSNKMLAKICSDKNKPDGFFKLLTNNPDEIMMFMSNMNIRKIPFVGEKTEQKLNLLGIKTCNDFLEKFVDMFYILHDNTWEFLITCCYGIGSAYHDETREAINKSISCSETFKMTNDINKIRTVFEALVKRLYNTMLEDQIMGKNLGLEIKDKNDRTVSKTTSLKKYFETETEIREKGWNTLYSMIQNSSIRLIRVKMSGLTHINPEQLKKKTDKPIMKFLGKMNKLNESKNGLDNNELQKELIKEDNKVLDLKKSMNSGKGIKNFNDLEKNNWIEGSLIDDKFINDKNQKKIESRNIKEKDLLKMFSKASPNVKSNYPNCLKNNEKEILKTNNKKKVSPSQPDFHIQKEDKSSNLEKIRILSKSNSKYETSSKRSKKYSKNNIQSNNFFKLNEMIINMKPIDNDNKSLNEKDNEESNFKESQPYNLKKDYYKRDDNKEIHEYNSQTKIINSKNENEEKEAKLTNKKKGINSKIKTRKPKDSSINQNQIKIDKFLKKIN